MGLEDAPDQELCETKEQKLRLRPGAEVFEFSPDQLQISFPTHTATFSGTPVVKIVRHILDGLECSSRRKDIIDHVALNAEVGVGLVDYVFGLLQENHCLYWCDDSAHTSNHSAIGDFYASLGHDPMELLEKLSQSRVVAVVPAPNMSIAESLLQNGLTVDVVKISSSTKCKTVVAQLQERIVASPPHIMISWNVAYRLPLSRHLNDVAIENNLPILFGTCQGLVGRVGPYVIPRNTPCLECLNARLLASAGTPESWAFAAYRARYEDQVPMPSPVQPAFSQAVQGHFVMELVKILAGLPPQTIGGVIEVSFSTGLADRRAILKAPRCRSCSKQTPPRSAWQATFPAPLVKGGGE